MTNIDDNYWRQQVDLTNCDKEQIHIPGSVQSFGALVAFDGSQVITRASSTVEFIFGLKPAELIGKPLITVLKKNDIDRLLKAVDNFWQIRTCTLENGRRIDVLLHDAGKERYLDVLARDDDFEEPDSVGILRDFVAKVSKAVSVLDVVNILARTIRTVSGLDRVKIYQFDSDWNGEVIAEARHESVPSYLGLHFPQSDIPKQARELYQRNKVRVISDVNDKQSRITEPRDSRPLDLSFSFLRSVSEIHLQYLRNMEVMSSMSLSLYQGDRFWGLVACHHREAREFSFQEASLYESLADVASNRLTDLHKVEKAESLTESLTQIQEIVKTVTANGKLSSLFKFRPSMQELVRSTGSILAIDGAFVKNGAVPDDVTIGSVISWLERGREDVVAYDDLPERFSGDIGTYACGLLAARIKGSSKSWLMWLRLEVIDEVSWAGDPYKPSENTEFGARLYPRTSFELWKQVSRGKSAPWLEVERESARMLSEVISSLIERGVAQV